MSTFNHIASIIYSIFIISSLKTTPILYMAYAAGLTSETTFRKEVLHNISYKLLQLFLTCREIPVSKDMSDQLFKRDTVNTSLSHEEERDVVLHNRTVQAIHPAHEISNIHFMKSTRLQIQRRQNSHAWIKRH